MSSHIVYLYRNLTVSRTGDFVHHTVILFVFITTYIVNKTFIGVNLIGTKFLRQKQKFGIKTFRTFKM